MPHTKLPPAWAREHEVIPGAQWSAFADSDASLTRTSTSWRAGRGFSACEAGCTDPGHHHAAPAVDTEAIIARVMARLKLSGASEPPDILKY